MRRIDRACRLLLAAALAASTAGCGVAARTALLRNDVLSDAQQAVADTKINHGDMTIEAAVDRADTTYDPGQPITLSVKTSKSASVAILRVLPDGSTRLIYPNRARRDAAISANQALSVPAPGDNIRIVAADKPGVVLFEFVASTTGDAWMFKRAPDNGSDFADLGASSRNIAKDLVAALKIGGGHDTAATFLTVRVTGGGLF